MISIRPISNIVHSAAKPLQVMAFASGIQVVTRNSDNEVARLYYFTKASTDSPSKTVYFHDYASSTPYVFDFCWDMRAKIRLSEDFVASEYKNDGLDKILFQYYHFGIDIFIAGKNDALQTSCLLKSSNFSRTTDQQMVLDLINQSLPIPEVRNGTAKVVVSSRKRASHHEWLNWKSGDVLAIPLNHNGKEIGCLRARTLLGTEEVAHSAFAGLTRRKVAAC